MLKLIGLFFGVLALVTFVLLPNYIVTTTIFYIIIETVIVIKYLNYNEKRD